MTFRLVTVLYLFTLLAASLAVFGVWGILVAGLVFGFWLAVSRFAERSSLARRAWELVVALLIFASLVLTLPEVRPRSLRTMSTNHTKQLLLGILNYESANRCLPPAYVTDAQGTPLYSWRVVILPYLDIDNTWKQLHLDEPWDSPHNRPILDKMDDTVFTSPRLRNGRSPDGITNYVAIVDSGTIWPHDKTATYPAATDGASSTVALLEVGELDIHWAEPRDVSLDEAEEFLTGQSSHTEEVVIDRYFTSEVRELRNRVVGFLDGYVETVGPLKHRKDARALLTKAGGELITGDYELDTSPRDRHLRTIIHWDHIWGVTVWLALVLLPAVPAARRRIWPKEQTTENPENAELLEH